MKYEEEVFKMVSHELKRQEQKWGEQNHKPLLWLGIIMEELGEVAKAMIEDGTPYEYILHELTHTAACCVNAIDCIMRSKE